MSADDETKDDQKQLFEKPISSYVMEKLEMAADRIKNAEVLIVHLGAGMSADSGLPIYKDIATHPAYKDARITYADLCVPRWLDEDPSVFFGFWGHCFNEYRNTKPHEGYDILLKWRSTLFSESSRGALKYFEGIECQAPFFIVSSNVDGHCQKSGFKDEEINEIHGSIDWWQCSEPCCQEVWEAPKEFKFDVDLKTMLAKNKRKSLFKSGPKGFTHNYPTCVHCDKVARPAILMFFDSAWVDPGSRKAHVYQQWVERLEFHSPRITVLEIGAGTNVPTIRTLSQRYVSEKGSKKKSKASERVSVIRINPVEAFFPSDLPSYENCIGIELGALRALKELDRLLSEYPVVES